MKKKQVICIVILACLVMIGAVCFYRGIDHNSQKPNESNSEELNDSEMMHGEAEPDEKTDTNDIKEPQGEQESLQKQGGQTEWEEKQEQKPEQEQKKEEQENIPEEKEQKMPQPNTESGWGPIT